MLSCLIAQSLHKKLHTRFLNALEQWKGIMWKRLLEFSLKKVVNTVVYHVFSSQLVNYGVLTGVLAFLWFFYSAVADRIFPTVDAVLTSSSSIVNPLAYKLAFDNHNLLVILFPFIFFSLIVLVHYLWGKWWWFGSTLGLIFVFDCIVALVSSRKIHEHLLLNDRNYGGTWSFWPWASDYNAHVAIVVLCGFGTSFAAGLFYHAFMGIVDESDADTDIEE